MPELKRFFCSALVPYIITPIGLRTEGAKADSQKGRVGKVQIASGNLLVTGRSSNHKVGGPSQQNPYCQWESFSEWALLQSKVEGPSWQSPYGQWESPRDTALLQPQG